MIAATWTTGILLALAPSEAAKAESAQPLAIAAGATAVAGVGIGFAAAARTMGEYRCIVDRPEVDTSDGGGSPFDFECWGATGILFSAPIAALSVSTVVLSAVSGDRYGVADRLSGRRLDRETALAYTLGGIGARVGGAALIIGGAVLAAGNCPALTHGADLGCYRGRTYGAAALISAGAMARWGGTGLLAFGSRHLRDGRSRSRMAIRPSLLGITGQF